MIPNQILNDLCARFIINLPEKESQDVIRVFFQVELAHWFYLDFYWTENMGKACNLKEFAFEIFNYCPSLMKFKENFDQAFESWKIYKQSVPTYGAIMLDPGLEFCLLLQGYWVKSSWGFPKGKVNQDEDPIDCAIREVLEETGFDITNIIDPYNYLECQFNEQACRLYIIPGISMDTKFQAQTRQEIKDYTWFRVDYLPSHKRDNICKTHYNMNANAFFMVIPFLRELKIRIQQMKLKAVIKGQLVHTPHRVHAGQDNPQMPDQSAEIRKGMDSRKTTMEVVQKHKKEGTKYSHQLVEATSHAMATNSEHADGTTTHEERVGEEFPTFNFTSPAWSSFKLNMDEVIEAMCSVSTQ